MSATVLITGAAGFIGSKLCAYLLARNYTVIGVGHGSLPDEVRQLGGIKWLESDITLDALEGIRNKIDFIIHCAGSGSVNFSFSFPFQDYDKTVNSTMAILEFIRRTNRSIKFIYLSSAAVYGLKEEKPFKEGDELNPVSPYGYHKKIAEQLCEYFYKVYQIETTIIRFFSVYGPGLKKQLLWDACGKFHRSSHSHNHVEFYGTGTEVRDWLFIEDALSLIEAVMQNTDGFTILNGACGKKTTITTIIDELARQFDIKSDYYYFNSQTKAGDPKYYLADISKSLKIGWQPLTNLNEGLEKYVAWYKENNA